MNVGLSWSKLHSSLKALNRSANVALLQQSVTKLEARIGKVGAFSYDLLHQSDAPIGILARERNVTEMILCLHVAGIQCQLCFKLTGRLVEFTRPHVDHSGIEVCKAHLRVE